MVLVFTYMVILYFRLLLLFTSLTTTQIRTTRTTRPIIQLYPPIPHPLCNPSIIIISIYCFTFNKLALIATTIVLAVIKTAPAAGLNKMPSLNSTPAAKGNAITLYPVAQIRF
jgi:hypothetical protein